MYWPEAQDTEGFAGFAGLVGGLASLFFTLGPSTRSDRQFTFTCLDIDLSARQRLWFYCRSTGQSQCDSGKGSSRYQEEC